ncbi:MAG: hypothetical protein KAG94_01760 [Clostridiales bacterium]|nr:hypothetical protein [Clostridiales bacterium]
MKSYIYKDNVFEIEGALSIYDGNDFTQPWRIDFNRKQLFPYLNDDFQGGACSGVRIAFVSDCTLLAIDIVETHERDTGFHDVMLIDLVIDGKLIETLPLNQGKGVYTFAKLSIGFKKVELWLDHAFPVKFTKLLINDNAMMKKSKSPKYRWVHYGSSISHSVRAKTPATIWPGIVALQEKIHVTNLGFGGNCILDPIIGHEMSQLNADIFTLKLGINVHGGRLNIRSFEPCIIGLIETIRQNHIKTPIVLISPIIAPEYENTKGLSEMSLSDMRDILQLVVTNYNNLGDKNIYYVDGLEIMGQEGLKYMPDNVHPDGPGQFILADNFIKNVVNKYFYR